MATARATDPTVGTIGATPVLFFPVPTPWPMSAGCDKQIHRQINKGSILAWDPIYPRIGGSAGVERGESCYPTQHQSWFFQSSTATPSTALGPTFACPESYTAVFSTLIESNSASRTDYTYCCPPKYTLNALLPPNQRSAVQCTSLVPVGATLSFISVTFTPTVLSPSTTTNVLAYIPSSTVVTGVPETVFGGPINGYNIVAATAQPPSDSSGGSTPTPTVGGGGGGGAAPTGTGGPGGVSDTLTGTGPSPGTIAGAVVGGVTALALGVALAYFVGRRRSRSHAGAGAAVAGGGAPPPPGQQQTHYAVSPYGQQPRWEDKGSPYQFGVTPVSAGTTVVPVAEYGGNVRHELPSQSQRFELHGGGAEEGQGGYYRSG